MGHVGLEPTTYGLTLPLWLSPPFRFDGLDFAFTLAFALGAARQVSTPSLSGLARRWHFTAFAEFGQFYSRGFPLGTPFIKSDALPIELMTLD